MFQKNSIPHWEKVFSIFEEHTRWIAKGKAGKPVELGVPVCIVEDGNGFILDKEIMWAGRDTHAAAPLVEKCQNAFPDLWVCSFDREFLLTSTFFADKHLFFRVCAFSRHYISVARRRSGRPHSIR